MVAQGPFKPRVAGSNPAGGTTFPISERTSITMTKRTLGPVDSNFDSSLDSNYGRPSAHAGEHRRTAGRRANLEGSVHQRADGRWVAQATSPSGGKLYRYTSTRADAAAKLTTALAAFSEHRTPPSERQTVADFLEGWLENAARPSVRASTYESYAGVVRHHLTPDAVQGMLNRKLEAGLSPRRVDYLRGILHRALNQALRWGLVGRNVAGLVRSPKQVRYEIHPLDPDEVKALLAEVRGDRLEALFALAIATRMRRGELLGLRWEDVDLPRRVLHVRRPLERYQGPTGWWSPNRPGGCGRSAWRPSPSTPWSVSAPSRGRSGIEPVRRGPRGVGPDSRHFELTSADSSRAVSSAQRPSTLVLPIVLREAVAS